MMNPTFTATTPYEDYLDLLACAEDWLANAQSADLGANVEPLRNAIDRLTRAIEMCGGGKLEP